MRCHWWISANLRAGACFGSDEVQAHRSPVARAGIWHQITLLVSGVWELVALRRFFLHFRDSSYREAKSWTVRQDWKYFFRDHTNLLIGHLSSFGVTPPEGLFDIIWLEMWWIEGMLSEYYMSWYHSHLMEVVRFDFIYLSEDIWRVWQDLAFFVRMLSHAVACSNRKGLFSRPRRWLLTGSYPRAGRWS